MKTMTKTLVWLGISLFAATAWASGGFEIVKTVKISDAVALRRLCFRRAPKSDKFAWGSPMAGVEFGPCCR